MESYRDHARYGRPRAGGVLDQPVIWKIALDCIHDAMRHADLEAQEMSAYMEN